MGKLEIVIKTLQSFKSIVPTDDIRQLCDKNRTFVVSRNSKIHIIVKTVGMGRKRLFTSLSYHIIIGIIHTLKRMFIFLIFLFHNLFYRNIANIREDRKSTRLNSS